MIIMENTMTTNFEPHECLIFLLSAKIGTHENEAIHSTKQQWIVMKNQADALIHECANYYWASIFTYFL